MAFFSFLFFAVMDSWDEALYSSLYTSPPGNLDIHFTFGLKDLNYYLPLHHLHPEDREVKVRVRR